MSKARSPCTVCSTTIGICGLIDALRFCAPGFVFAFSPASVLRWCSLLQLLADRAPGRARSCWFRTSVSQSVGSLLRSSTGTRTNSSRAPLSSTRVSCCVFGRRRSSDGSRPVRRRTSFTATSLKPGFLYQGTPPGGYGTGRHCRSRPPCLNTAAQADPASRPIHESERAA